MRVGLAARLKDFFVCRLLFQAEGYVLPHGHLEECWLLLDERHAVAEILEKKIGGVCVAQEDTAGCWVVEAFKEGDKGAFPTARGSDAGNVRAMGDLYFSVTKFKREEG